MATVEQFVEAFEFFHANGHIVCRPGQGIEAGRRETAIRYALAELGTTNRGIEFKWNQDDITDADFRETDDPYPLWVCVAYRRGRPVASLCGIDLGRDGSLGDDYARVVQASLAIEAQLPGDGPRMRAISVAKNQTGR